MDGEGFVRVDQGRFLEEVGRVRFSEGGFLSILNGENRRSKGLEVGEVGESIQVAFCTGGGEVLIFKIDLEVYLFIFNVRGQNGFFIVIFLQWSYYKVKDVLVGKFY